MHPKILSLLRNQRRNPVPSKKLRLINKASEVLNSFQKSWKTYNELLKTYYLVKRLKNKQ